MYFCAEKQVQTVFLLFVLLFYSLDLEMLMFVLWSMGNDGKFCRLYFSEKLFRIHFLFFYLYFFLSVK